MYTFPGENSELVLKNDIPVYEQHLLNIGDKVTCKVYKNHPFQLNVHITHKINTERSYSKLSITYRGILRLKDYKSGLDSKIFLDGIFNMGDVFDAMVVSFGDGNGCYLSTMSDGLGIPRD